MGQKEKADTKLLKRAFVSAFIFKDFIDPNVSRRESFRS